MKKETDMPPSTEETASIAESAEEVSENREQGGEPPAGGGPAVIDDSAADDISEVRDDSDADDETISRRRKVVGIGLIGLGLVFLADQFFDLSVRGTDSPYMAIGEFQSHRTPLISEYTESHEYHLKITQKDNPVWLPIGLGELRGDSLSLSLSRDVRWSIDMNLGAADAKLDLRDLTLADLTLDSGASKVDLTLGPHVAEGAEVVVKGGAGSYQISLPKELDLSVRIDTALTSKNMDPALEDQGSGEYTHDGGGPPLRVRISAGVSSVRVNLY